MRFRLTPRSMTLDDLELLKVRIFGEFRRISQTQKATTAKRETLVASDSVVTHYVDLPQIFSPGAFIHALLSRAHLSVSQAFLQTQLNFTGSLQTVLLIQHYMIYITTHFRSFIFCIVSRVDKRSITHCLECYRSSALRALRAKYTRFSEHDHAENPSEAQALQKHARNTDTICRENNT